MRYLSVLALVFLSGCGLDHAHIGFSPVTGTATVDVTMKDTKGRVLYAPGQTHDLISGRALASPAGTRDACGTCGETRSAGQVNPCAPAIVLKPSLRERFKNAAMVRDLNYIRDIHDDGATPVTRALGIK